MGFFSLVTGIDFLDLGKSKNQEILSPMTLGFPESRCHKRIE